EAPAGTTEATQVYVRFASPPSSPPRTLRVVIVPDTGFGDADAADTTNGALSTFTVTLALPLTVPDEALTLNVPMLSAGAVYSPVESMLPPLAVTDQLSAGLAMTLLN